MKQIALVLAAALSASTTVVAQPPQVRLAMSKTLREARRALESVSELRLS
jgi:hypothetical protein